MLATQGIRGGGNREVLKRIKETGDIFFAESDRPWVLAGANVHVSMAGFNNGDETERICDGLPTETINSNLSALASDSTTAQTLKECSSLSFLGSCKGGPFDIEEVEALQLLDSSGNPHGLPNSDMVRPVCNSEDLVKKPGNRWIIDTADRELNAAALYEEPFKIITERVKPLRDANRDKWLRTNWWRPQRMRPEMRTKIEPLDRFIVTTTTSKHRLFMWLTAPTLPDHQLIVFGRDDDYFFGVLHSRLHEVWALKQGTRLETRPRYTPTTCFETFPLPRPTPEQETAIATAAKELNELRERWLNPSEWTETRLLEFPGSLNGPWARHVDKASVNPETGVGTVRYPRLEPRDAECAAKLAKRTLTNLYNERPAWLAHAHATLDEAVCAAYDWPADLNDDQILERLLALNLKRAAEEAQAAAATAKPKAQRKQQEDEML